MSEPQTATAERRPLRADARRNRDAILAAAVEVFAEHGVEIALDEVARRARVGIATLYRHFPTREALITGAYVREVGLLCDGVDRLLATMPADEALIRWMQRFVGYVAGKPGMGLALKSIVMTTDAAASRATHDRVFQAVDQLMAAAERDSLIRADVPREDVLGAMSGITLATGERGKEERAKRLVVLLVDGLRYRA